MHDGANSVHRGSAGVPPAVFRILRNTPGRRGRFVRKQTSAVCHGGRVARQAGRPRYPRHAVRLFHVSRKPYARMKRCSLAAALRTVSIAAMIIFLKLLLAVASGAVIFALL